MAESAKVINEHLRTAGERLGGINTYLKHTKDTEEAQLRYIKTVLNENTIDLFINVMDYHPRKVKEPAFIKNQLLKVA